MNVFNKGKYVDSGNAFNFSAQKLIPHVIWCFFDRAS